MATATKKAPKPRKKREPKPKQQYFEGTEPVVIKAIEAAAEKYCEVRDARMTETKEEGELKQKLIAVMKEHGQTSYRFNGQLIELKNIENVTVRKEKQESANGKGE